MCAQRTNWENHSKTLITHDKKFKSSSATQAYATFSTI